MREPSGSDHNNIKTTIVYTGGGGLTIVTKDGKLTDILTGSIFAEGPTTGICRGDADSGVTVHTTEKERTIIVDSNKPTNK